jgi:hypothetical protein
MNPEAHSTSTPSSSPSCEIDPAKRDACIFSAERTLDCGSIVTERNGRIIAKATFLPKP